MNKSISCLTVNDDGIRYVPPAGEVVSVTWADLQVVGIETNEGGPFIEDVYFDLEGSGYAFYIPQGAAGTEELVTRLANLPGYDRAAFVSAMSSTRNARFVVWRRPASGVTPAG